MKKVCWPYFDPEFDSLVERIYGPACRVCIDNESLEDCTIVKVDSVNKQGLLLEVVQRLTDMNLTISKGYISSDAGWFMDVFQVKDVHGKKITDHTVLDYIQQAIGTTSTEAPKGSRKMLQSELPHNEHTAIEMTGADRPGLFSEISAALADLHCNIVEAHAWSHNARLACVAFISDQHSTDNPIQGCRLTAIEDHLTTVLRATAPAAATTIAAAVPGEAGTVTGVERRLHQLMVSVRDFDRPALIATEAMTTEDEGRPEREKKRRSRVTIERCDEKGYSIVTVRCRDRPRLLFDTVCTLTDMQYVIFHASVDSRRGYAFQEYFIRHVDGCALNTEGEKDRVIKCLEAAIDRRVCEGVRLELCATNRVGLLSDITRVLRENGLTVVRADVETHGGKAVNVFYVRDLSGKDVDIESIKSIKREMGAVDLAVKKETAIAPSSPKKPQFSITDLLKSHIHRLSHSFIAIK